VRSHGRWSTKRLHALKGRLQGLHSVSINISYRITLELMLIDGQRLIPIDIGSHDAVYRS
jgi:plasmid maintenance system killer protein